MYNISMDKLTILPGTRNEADVAASLTFMAYHIFSYDIFGEVGEERATALFKHLWLHGNNRFGHQYSYIGWLKNSPVALMTCYPAPLITKLVPPTVWQLVRAGRLAFIWHILSHLDNFYYLASSHDIPANEFYVATLSVLPKHRGCGIGAEMLSHARELTEILGMRRCTLHVNAENKDGIRFYERNGFVKTETSESTSNYFRMVNPV